MISREFFARTIYYLAAAGFIAARSAQTERWILFQPKRYIVDAIKLHAFIHILGDKFLTSMRDSDITRRTGF